MMASNMLIHVDYCTETQVDKMTNRKLGVSVADEMPQIRIVVGQGHNGPINALIAYLMHKILAYTRWHSRDIYIYYRLHDAQHVILRASLRRYMDWCKIYSFLGSVLRFSFCYYFLTKLLDIFRSAQELFSQIGQ